MTIEEWGDEYERRRNERNQGEWKHDRRKMIAREVLLEIITAAVEQEREACARIADHPTRDQNLAGSWLREKYASEIAKEIRARGEKA